MKSLVRLTLIIAIMLTGAAAAVAGSDTAPKTVEIVGTDNMKFDVTSIKVAPGEQITIVFTTDSEMPKQAMAHNVVVVDKDADIDAVAQASMMASDNNYISPDHKEAIVAATDMAGGGETVEVTFTAPEAPGDYPYICTFPGHYLAGMKGMLTVE